MKNIMRGGAKKETPQVSSAQSRRGNTCGSRGVLHLCVGYFLPIFSRK